MYTNKFTKTFNNIVESYGVATYGEVNPAVWTIATFPFLFAVMYGDVGHGIMLLIPAIFLCVFERRFKGKDFGEIFGMMFRARYLLVLMALCAVYTGFLYNEFYALPMNLASTQWQPVPGSEFWAKKGAATFPFGVDPIWKVAENELQFYNSLKMKLSIVLAYFHMMLGICMHAFNAIHFNRPYDLWFEFVPRAIFLTCIIGYMVLLILLKWTTNWAAIGPTPEMGLGGGASAAPYIIGIMINMFLSPLSTAEPRNCYWMLGCPFQTYLEFVLLIVAVACVPIMLLAKPFAIKRDIENGDVPPEYRHHPFEFSELMVHQIIETIEFVLGAISNTASYLRLWALSLAHSELSIVFWEKALGSALTYSAKQPALGSVAIFVAWAVWAAGSVGVLILMEALSSFLHALRLHWVEFQNKFYNLHGSGVKFAPFNLRRIAKEGRKAATELAAAIHADLEMEK